MVGLFYKKYMQTTKKKFDPIAMIISLGGLFAVIYSTTSYDNISAYIDYHSLIIVVGGTIASILFQFDFGSTIHGCALVFKSLWGTPGKKLLSVVQELDEAIVNLALLKDLREGHTIDGELLNDIVYMYGQGLIFEEIDEFVTSRISDEYLGRRIAVDLLRKAAVIAPSLGLFGTVMGLIGVLKTLQDPGKIGASMSLALMTTAYGAALGSLVFTPLAGRLEHHNMIYLEVHQQILSKIGILLSREERNGDRNSSAEGIAA